MNAPRSWPKFWLSLSVSVLFAAACSNNNPSTTGGNGSGATGDHASGGTTTGATGAASTGTTTGIPPPEDPIGTGCSQTGNGDYASCATSADCQCPLLCGLDFTQGGDDAGGSICTMPCKQDSECPDIFTHCDSHGLCTTDICEADGGSDNAPFFGACDSSGNDDGTCEPSTDKSHIPNIIGICFQAGSALPGDGCDPTYPPFALASAGNTKRPSGKSLCQVGYECNGQTMKCQQLCDPVFEENSDNDGGGCADDLTCQAIGKDTRFGGACQATGDGGCTIGQGGGELGDCTLTSDCGCPLSCFTDFAGERHSCEKVCKDTATDCDVPYTTCQKDILAPELKYCNYNYCAQSFLSGDLYTPDGGSDQFGSACNYLGDGDGSCQLEYSTDQFGNLLNTFGYCVPGTVPTGGGCGAPGDPNPPYCVQGDVCVPFQSGSLCEPPCNPEADGGTGCPPGDGCFFWIPRPFLQVTGVCQACTKAQDPKGCQDSSECCDGFCDYNADAGTGLCN